MHTYTYLHTYTRTYILLLPIVVFIYYHKFMHAFIWFYSSVSVNGFVGELVFLEFGNDSVV